MINLSNNSFTVYEYKVLGYNSNFIPTPEHLNKYKLMQNISDFSRSIKLKAHFKNETLPDKNDESFRFRPAPAQKWTPPNVHHTVNTFIESFENQVKNESKKCTRTRKNNLNKHELKALMDLQQRDDIIIINADKGGAMTIIDTKDYIKEANRQLSDPNSYRKLSYNPTSEHTNTVNTTIDIFKNQHKIPEKIADGLKVVSPKTPTLKLPPKVHKPGHPGRPLVSSIDSPTSKISEYVDFHLQPYTDTIKSHIKDTNHFLNELHKIPPEQSKENYLVTLDIRSLYTNIPNEEGINVIKNLLQRKESKLTTVITAFLWLILTLNNFVFNATNYLQLSGVAMGTKCAVIYANLFMSHFEETHIYPLLINKCTFYKRFIDDIFLLWTGTLDELQHFLDTLNTLHPTIKFDAKYSKTSVEFLDTKVYKSSNGKLQTTLYTKPTDRQSYLHNKSYHPSSCKRSIAYSQALRIKRICSEAPEFEQHTKKLSAKLVQRGYDQKLVDEQIDKARQTDRLDLLKPKDPTPPAKNILAVTYNKGLPNLKKAIDDNWNILSINPTLAPLFREKPILAFRRNRNLQNLVCKHKLKNNKPVQKVPKKHGKCRPCLTDPKNKCCKQMTSTTHFTNRKTGRKFQIFHNLNCRSSKVIYLIECTLCGNKPYVGKSETASNLRTNNHRHDAKKPDSIMIDKHFYETPGHDFEKHAKITLIEQLRNAENMTKEEITFNLEKREDFWMIKLNTLQPDGFNIALNHSQ